ncbi:MAG: PKD domain-containing protein, partial [Thermodesulfovibrionales bacterium]
IPNAVVSYQIDFEGDGIIDYTGPAFEDISHAYTTEGIYYPTVTVTDDQGNVFTDKMTITVLDKAKIDALLKGKWEGMKAALLAGNVEPALNHFVDPSKEKYRRILSVLKPYLSLIAADMREINLNSIRQDVAEYRIIRTENIGGQLRGIMYLIYFVKDEHGLWKIASY